MPSKTFETMSLATSKPPAFCLHASHFVLFSKVRRLGDEARGMETVLHALEIVYLIRRLPRSFYGAYGGSTFRPLPNASPVLSVIY